MAYRRNNYDFVIDSSFQPFSMQEMLVPFTAYKQAYEESEKAYTELSDKADKFKYLSENLDPNSKAAQIYAGYADTLRAQAEDLAHNGLNMGNRRALTGLKRDYQGTIGRLDLADAALQKEKELRRQMSAKDSSMLYADNNLNIDNFLDNNTPNLFSISGNELYAKGAAAGKAASARIYSNPEVQKLHDQYLNILQTQGYSPEVMQKFRDDMASNPELQKVALDLIKANNVENLGKDTANYQTAVQQVINGIADGAIYQRNDKPVQNGEYMDAAQRQSYALQRESMNRQAAAQGLKWNGSNYVYDSSIDPSIQRAKEIAKFKGATGGAGSSSSGSGGSKGKGGSTTHNTQLKKRMVFEWQGNDPSTSKDEAKNVKPSFVADDETELTGTLYNYDDLPQYAKDQVDEVIGYDGADADYYQYYFQPYKKGIFNDTEAKLEIVPRTIVTDDNSGGVDTPFSIK